MIKLSQSKKSHPIGKGVHTTETNDENHNLIGHELEDVNSAESSQSNPATMEEVPKQIKAVTDFITKQLERLGDLVKELRLVTLKPYQDTSGVIQGSQ